MKFPTRGFSIVILSATGLLLTMLFFSAPWTSGSLASAAATPAKSKFCALVPKILERDDSQMILAFDKEPAATAFDGSMAAAIKLLVRNATAATNEAPSQRLGTLLRIFVNNLATSKTPASALTAVDDLRASYLQFDAACPSNFGTQAEAPGPQVQSGFSGTEKFCAAAPLRGTIEYNDVAGNVALNVTLAGLRARTSIVVNWQNNQIRGYAVAYFFSNQRGQSSSGSLLIYRPGESHGSGVVLTSLSAKILGRLSPC
jgi:hypothetical protein